MLVEEQIYADAFRSTPTAYPFWTDCRALIFLDDALMHSFAILLRCSNTRQISTIIRPYVHIIIVVGMTNITPRK